MDRCKHYTPEHAMLQASARAFFERECVPRMSEWEAAGAVPREIWVKAAEAGFLSPTVSETYGGAGGDFLHSLVISWEQVRAGISGFGLSVHNDIVCPYIETYGTEEQKRRWLPQLVTANKVAAIAMTEPGAGSDLRGVRTSAVRNGDSYILNGQKTFITNGGTADLIIVVARTSQANDSSSMSLIVLETDRAIGFSRGATLQKIGQKAGDTCELFFENVAVPAENLLGGAEGRGMYQLMERLAQERLLVGALAVGSMERAVEITSAYVKQRRAFGQPLSAFQNTRFKLAEMATYVTIAKAFMRECIDDFMEARLSPEKAAMLKWWATDTEFSVIDAGVQLHGGYGYMWEQPIARMFVDSRAGRIYAGTNEIMKELIGRSL